MKNEHQWAVIIARQVPGIGPEYLAEDRHDDRGTPFWIGQRENPFVLRFWHLQEAAQVAVAYPGARLECVLVE